MKNWISYVLISILLGGCQQQDHQKLQLPNAVFGVIDGAPVKETDLIKKSAVLISIKRENDSSAVCTGGVLAPTIILTEAHFTDR